MKNRLKEILNKLEASVELFSMPGSTFRQPPPIVPSISFDALGIPAYLLPGVDPSCWVPMPLVQTLEITQWNTPYFKKGSETVWFIKDLGGVPFQIGGFPAEAVYPNEVLQSWIAVYKVGVDHYFLYLVSVRTRTATREVDIIVRGVREVRSFAHNPIDNPWGSNYERVSCADHTERLFPGLTSVEADGYNILTGNDLDLMVRNKAPIGWEFVKPPVARPPNLVEYEGDINHGDSGIPFGVNYPSWMDIDRWVR